MNGLREAELTSTNVIDNTFKSNFSRQQHKLYIVAIYVKHCYSKITTPIDLLDTFEEIKHSAVKVSGTLHIIGMYTTKG